MSATEGANFETISAIAHVAPAARGIGRVIDEGEAALQIGAQLQSRPIGRAEKQRKRKRDAKAKQGQVWCVGCKTQVC